MQTQNVSYAGFWIRTAATIIDSILILMITAPLLIAIYGTDYYLDPDNFKLIEGPADFAISWIMPIIATIVFWIYKQATPGKMAVSIKIVDANTGNPPTTGQYIGRYFAYFLSFLPFCLGFLWVAFDDKKQGWHDKFAGTLVVSYRTKPVEWETGSVILG